MSRIPTEQVKKAKSVDLLSYLQTFEPHSIRKSGSAHRAVYNEYAGIKNNPKKREAYYTKHKTEIEAFKDAREYLNSVMNGRTDPLPIKEWRKEQQSLTAAKYAACERYYALQDEVRSCARARRISCVRTCKKGNRAGRRMWHGSIKIPDRQVTV